METRLFRYLENIEVDHLLLNKMNKLSISINLDYLTARKSGLTIQEAHKALSLAREFSKYGLEIIIRRIEAKSLENTSHVIKRWKRVAGSPTIKKHFKLL
jgi:hypothetical protein